MADDFFDADLPADVAGSWSAALDETNDPDVASRRVLREYREALRDAGDAAVVLTALAALHAHAAGEGNELRDRADKAIAAGEREGALTEDVAALLRAQLALDTPPDLPSDYTERSNWRVGDAFAYRAAELGWVVLRTVGHYKFHDLKVPVVDVLDWRGTAPPSRSDVASARVRSKASLKQEFNGSVGPWDRIVFSNKDEDTAFVLARKSDNDLPDEQRLRYVGKIPAPRLRRHARTNRIVTWRKLDAHLAVLFSQEP